jgi:putative endonuclease
MRGGYVCMMTNEPLGVLYTGVTADIAARAFQHRSGTGSKFCRRYNCDKLALVEEYPTIEEAIAREKAIKAWPRLWKLELIHTANPNWDDLFERLIG